MGSLNHIQNCQNDRTKILPTSARLVGGSKAMCTWVAQLTNLLQGCFLTISVLGKESAVRI